MTFWTSGVSSRSTPLAGAPPDFGGLLGAFLAPVFGIGFLTTGFARGGGAPPGVSAAMLIPPGGINCFNLPGAGFGPGESLLAGGPPPPPKVVFGLSGVGCAFPGERFTCGESAGEEVPLLEPTVVGAKP